MECHPSHTMLTLTVVLWVMRCAVDLESKIFTMLDRSVPISGQGSPLSITLGSCTEEFILPSFVDPPLAQVN